MKQSPRPRQEHRRNGSLQDGAVEIHPELDQALLAQKPHALDRAAGRSAVARGGMRPPARPVEVDPDLLWPDHDIDLLAIGHAGRKKLPEWRLGRI